MFELHAQTSAAKWYPTALAFSGLHWVWVPTGGVSFLTEPWILLATPKSVTLIDTRPFWLLSSMLSARNKTNIKTLKGCHSSMEINIFQILKVATNETTTFHQTLYSRIALEKYTNND